MLNTVQMLLTYNIFRSIIGKVKYLTVKNPDLLLSLLTRLEHILPLLVYSLRLLLPYLLVCHYLVVVHYVTTRIVNLLRTIYITINVLQTSRHKRLVDNLSTTANSLTPPSTLRNLQMFILRLYL